MDTPVKCRKRRRFRDYDAAMRYLERLRERRTGGHVERRAYYCKLHAGYHLTSAPDIGGYSL